MIKAIIATAALELVIALAIVACVFGAIGYGISLLF